MPFSFGKFFLISIKREELRHPRMECSSNVENVKTAMASFDRVLKRQTLSDLVLQKMVSLYFRTSIRRSPSPMRLIILGNNGLNHSSNALRLVFPMRSKTISGPILACF